MDTRGGSGRWSKIHAKEKTGYRGGTKKGQVINVGAGYVSAWTKRCESDMDRENGRKGRKNPVSGRSHLSAGLELCGGIHDQGDGEAGRLRRQGRTHHQGSGSDMTLQIPGKHAYWEGQSLNLWFWKTTFWRCPRRRRRPKLTCQGRGRTLREESDLQKNTSGGGKDLAKQNWRCEGQVLGGLAKLDYSTGELRAGIKVC